VKNNTIYDKIKKSITSQLKENRLAPGDKLPSYSQLCNKFNVSYASVQYAFKEFEKEGLVERIQGVGTFLKGASPLEVEIFLDTSAFPPEELETLLKKFISKADLHIDLTIKNTLEAYNAKKLNKNRRVAIVQDTLYPHFDIGASLDLSSFSDYKFIIGQLKTQHEEQSNLALPFHFFSFQIAQNPLLTKKLGFYHKLNGSDWEWWEDYIDSCKENGITPAVKRWDMHALWSFSHFKMLLFPLIINERKKCGDILSLPLFKTKSGKTLLKIMKSHCTVARGSKEDKEFHSGNVGINISAGSWIAAHYKKRFKIADEAIKIIPHQFENRKICFISKQYLKPFVCADIKPDEKKRVWELLKIFASREFQIKICEMSGAISVRKDILPEEHPWNTRKDFNAFFPGDNDIIINQDIFNERVTAALSTLYEQYEFYGADEDQILESMDKKVESMLKPT
jgi:DNA-binding transcriptional regulator YhcF (GntR family)